MIFRETKLKGAFLLELEKHSDERGFFARTFCQNEFASHGLDTNLVQCNLSFNRSRGILRGMHFQLPPKEEGKLVRCTRGAIFDVIIDLRRDSPTYCQWVSAELTEQNYSALYVPPGFAHGFQTLSDNSEVIYQMSEFYDPALSAGLRWNDPAFAISWPDNSPLLSGKDEGYPDFQR